MSFNFTDENLAEIEALKKRYPSPKALTLPCLWMVEYQEGFISLDAIDEIAKHRNVHLPGLLPHRSQV